jgi:hypothetical protein
MELLILWMLSELTGAAALSRDKKAGKIPALEQHFSPT